MPARRPSLRPTHLATAILLGLAVPGVVLAQDEVSADSTARTLDTVNVTGSRIKRTDVEAALPITIIQRAEIEAQGISSAEQLLQQLNRTSFRIRLNRKSWMHRSLNRTLNRLNL